MEPCTCSLRLTTMLRCLSTGLTASQFLGWILQRPSLKFTGLSQRKSCIDLVSSNRSLTGTPCRPLSSIGLPFYDAPLLSSWSPPVLAAPYYPPAARIPPQILQTMKTNDNVAYAPLPKELRGRRNLVTAGAKKDSARFRSGKGRKEVSHVPLHSCVAHCGCHTVGSRSDYRGRYPYTRILPACGDRVLEVWGRGLRFWVSFINHYPARSH
jgi:hypothetical protein